MTKDLSAKEVELYLLKNTDFFLSRESIVSELSFKHSSSEAESLLERQVRKLRDEQKRLLDSLSIFLANASENEELFQKSKAFILNVINAVDEKALTEMIPENLKEIFKIDDVSLKLFSNSEVTKLEKESGMEFSVNQTYYGSLSTKKINTLFENDSVKSAVVSVFKNGNKIGMLLIGSHDKTRYLGDEDTTFVEFIRDIIAARLDAFDN
tara:strand:- start:2095 stop:2724 length:630 start_codon:yes stop_codon:yes gene_type:complete